MVDIQGQIVLETVWFARQPQDEKQQGSKALWWREDREEDQFVGSEKLY